MPGGLSIVSVSCVRSCCLSCLIGSKVRRELGRTREKGGVGEVRGPHNLSTGPQSVEVRRRLKLQPGFYGDFKFVWDVIKHRILKLHSFDNYVLEGEPLKSILILQSLRASLKTILLSLPK